MPLEDGDYEPRTKDDIISTFETELKNEFGVDVDLTESSVFSAINEAYGTALADNQEQDLAEVHDSAFLDTAVGDHLDLVVELVGVSRKEAVKATGTVRWSKDSPTTQDHTIQKGTTVQTDSDDPVKFETTESAILEFLEGFETDLTNYSGDTGTFSRNSTTVKSGSNSLEVPSNNGDEIHDSQIEVENGSQIHGRVYLNATTAVGFRFGWIDSDNYYELVIDDNGTRFALESTDGGTTSTVTEDTSADPPTGEWLEFVIDWDVDGEFDVELLDASGTSVSDPSNATNTDHERGGIGFVSLDANDVKFVDDVALSAISTDIEASEAGADGNVGSDAIIVAPSFPTGLDSVTNPFPTGDSSYTDTDGDQFVSGQDEEDDDALRDRTRETVTAGGVATADSILSGLLQEVDNVTSVTLKENKTDTDNTGTGGLPPHSFECVVLGGTDQNVADKIFEKKAVTARDYGGANGTKTSKSVTATNDQTFTIDFSRPTATKVDVEIDITTLDTYVGDTEIQNIIADYIGGKDTDGNSVIGTGVGEDIYLDTIRELVLEDDNGVRSVTALDIHDDGTTTSKVTTNSDGESIVSISDTNVAEVDASDGSITVNTTAV